MPAPSPATRMPGTDVRPQSSTFGCQQRCVSLHVWTQPSARVICERGDDAVMQQQQVGVLGLPAVVVRNDTARSAVSTLRVARSDAAIQRTPAWDNRRRHASPRRISGSAASETMPQRAYRREPVGQVDHTGDPSPRVQHLRRIKQQQRSLPGQPGAARPAPGRRSSTRSARRRPSSRPEASSQGSATDARSRRSPATHSGENTECAPVRVGPEHLPVRLDRPDRGVPVRLHRTARANVGSMPAPPRRRHPWRLASPAPARSGRRARCSRPAA